MEIVTKLQEIVGSENVSTSEAIKWTLEQYKESLKGSRSRYA